MQNFIHPFTDVSPLMIQIISCDTHFWYPFLPLKYARIFTHSLLEGSWGQSSLPCIYSADKCLRRIKVLKRDSNLQ